MSHPAATSHPSTRRRGGEANVGRSREASDKTKRDERKLDQGLEESMAGSDPVSVIQPTVSKQRKPLP